jgi:molybdate transport system substrate-binding protein
MIPQSFYEPIRQDVVLLQRGKKNPAAMAFLEFLKSNTAQRIIQSYGYTTG